MYHKCNVLVRSLHKLNIAHTPYIAYHTCNINIAIIVKSTISVCCDKHW